MQNKVSPFKETMAAETIHTLQSSAALLENP